MKYKTMKIPKELFDKLKILGKKKQSLNKRRNISFVVLFLFK